MTDDRLRAHLGELGASAEELVGLDNDDLIGLAGDMHLRGGLDATVDDVATRSPVRPRPGSSDLRGNGLTNRRARRIRRW